jgi:hypothetical protein
VYLQTMHAGIYRERGAAGSVIVKCKEAQRPRMTSFVEADGRIT